MPQGHVQGVADSSVVSQRVRGSVWQSNQPPDYQQLENREYLLNSSPFSQTIY